MPPAPSAAETYGAMFRSRRRYVAVAVTVLLVVLFAGPIYRRLTVPTIPIIFVVGFHHSGTSLLRHMLGSHPDAFEVAREQKATALHLQEARVAAQEHGKKYVVMKRPVNDAKSREAMEQWEHANGVFFVTISRDRADVIYSLSKRSRRTVDEEYAGNMNGNIERTFDGFMQDSPAVTLEALSSDTERTLQALCDQLPMPYHKDMLDYWKTPFPYDNNGKKTTVRDIDPADSSFDAHKDHAQLRVSEINKPVHPSSHAWLKDAGVSAESREILSRYSTY